MEDQVLINRFLKNKSEKAFRALYKKYAPRLYNLALKITGYNTHLSEDALQEMWLIMAQKLNSFQGKSTLNTWLTGILINVIREKWRKAGKEEALSEQEESYTEDIFTEGFSCTQFDLQNALVQLPYGYRQIIVLHDLEGYKHKEIGQILDIQEGTSKSQLFKARGRLRKLLLAYQNTPEKI
ncbi:MAG TPA: RNA polymerase subunit sigma-24 [Microscillaceae bacterium]|nr:RNA polymerase subunit sigma-24 [Microscillaceae bacterium]